MEFDQQQNAIKELRAGNRNRDFVISILSLCLLISVVSVLSVLGTERTIVVPPNISKTFWVTGTKASADYLEQMGSFIAWLILDVSPASIDWKRDMLLTYVSPDKFGALKSQQDLEAERLKQLNASTFFLPQQVVVDEPSQGVVVRGRLRTQVNGQDTTTESKAYLAKFQYAGGRVHLETFKEIPYESKTAMHATSPADAGAGAAN